MKKWFIPKLVLLVLLMALKSNTFGQISLVTAGTAYTQNFNSLAQTGSSNTWTDNTTIFGWYSNQTIYISGTGSGTTGGLYSFGATSSSNRALGALTSGGTPTVYFGVRLKNNTGGSISKFNISFTGEEWRQQTAAQTLAFQYQALATTLTTGTWVANTNFDFVSPKIGAAGLLDGTATGNNTSISGTLTLVTPLADGQELWLRWSKTGSNSLGLAIDDFSVTPVSSNADLSNLVLSAGVLAPAFGSATSYTASVANGINSITITPTSAESHASITVNSNTVVSSSPSAAIPLNVGDNTITTTVTAQDGTTKTYTVIVTRAAAGVAAVTATSSLASFGNVCINTTTAANSFVIDGNNLDGSNISIGALPGFSYSETLGGTYSTTLSFSYTGNSFTGKTIYVEFNPTAIQPYDGNIVLSGGGITNYNVAATGSGVNTPPTITTSTATSVSATTATVAATLTANGCNPVTEYGIEYSPNSGFANGTGTQIISNNLSSGNYSITISGLSANTKYYYKAYAVSGGATTYGAQQSFIDSTLPVKMSDQPGYSYTENFADIANWSNFFTSGVGANHFNGLSTVTVGAIPDGKTITLSSGSFQGATFGSSGGVQRGTDQSPATQSIVLLATGTSDNTTTTAIDFYMDFTGLNAGTLSFDWASINNSTGNRNSSLRVYTSTDGVNFDTLKNASVLNFTNNSPTNDTKANIPLPASFNNSATARLRFYVYNGTGGTTGSRPKISIDNLTVTAVATTPCVSPTAPATNLSFGAITDTTIAGSFTAAGTTTDSYVVVASTNSSLTKNPDDGQIYNLGDNLGDGTVVAKGSSTSFVASGLTASTQYYFFVFPMNSICTGGPLYYSTTFLTGQASTVAGLPTCAAPATQPTAYQAVTTGTNTLSGSFTATTADEYLVLVSTSSTFSGTINNGQLYSNGDVVGNATVVQRSNATTFNASGLAASTTYYFYIFGSNTQACVNGPAYNVVSPLSSGAQTTNPLPTCSAPAAQPTQLTFTASNSAISGAFTPSASADDYLVVMSLSAINPIPINGTDYNIGDNLGGGSVVANSSSNSFMVKSLAAGTQYYFYVFAANKICDGGTKYLTTSPLTNNTTTTNVLANNYYFGNIHSHSDYSDGNKDNPGYTPANDYTYAKTAQCMDFLGISEHNHYSGGDPGNKISTYRLGILQADSFTVKNPNFLAMYGMEWGVISGGGHVVVYGDGMNQLFGWESGSGGWGNSDNYDVYVPKSVYTGPTGLFKTINDNIATNTFGTLAHPNQTDYNNLAGIAYDASADSAISGAAVESGPATSTNTTYTNPGTSLSYLPYFQTLLAKGYHLGPTIDHDNHNTTFGHTTYSRTAVVAPALTKTEILKGYRNMHFYATQDCDSKVDFTINTNMMGSIVTDRYAPIINVNLSDATTNTSSAIIKIMYGVPGSGIIAAKIDSVIGSSLTFTDNNLANLATGYYYADITNGTAHIITSPIWYTRNDAASVVVLPVSLSAFTAQKSNSSVKLSWTTAQETNSGSFVIERSVDGNSWTNIGTQAAAGNTSKPTDYIFYDNSPLDGINYYRLKEVDLDGKATYSATRSVLFASRFQLSVSPNPAHDYINLYVSNASNETYHIQLTDTNGKLLKNFDSSEQHLLINTSTFAKGMYFIKYVDNNTTITKKVIIE